MRQFKKTDFPTITGMLDYLHQERGYSLSDIARMSGSSLSCISVYNSGKRSNAFIERILKIYHLYLLDKKFAPDAHIADLRFEKSDEEDQYNIFYRPTQLAPKHYTESEWANKKAR